jgi:ABC-type amino acid transport substrate-binding protein
MIMLLIRLLCGSALLAMCFIMPSCKTGGPSSETGGNILRVGVCPDYPPLIFKANGKLMGAEVDFARELSRALDRPIGFIELKWDDLIEALLQARVDIVMSGMTITEARKVRVAFSEPYLKLGIMPLVRSRDRDKYLTAESIFNGYARIGVQKGTTADALANREIKSANAINYLAPSDAYFYLTSRRIDVFLHDGPAVIWLAAQHEADLDAPRVELTKDELGWAMRKDKVELLNTVNQVLAQWKNNGTTRRILNKWLPEIHKSK